MQVYKAVLKDKATGQKVTLELIGGGLDTSKKYIIAIDRNKVSMEDIAKLAEITYRGLGIEAVFCYTDGSPHDAIAMFDIKSIETKE